MNRLQNIAEARAALAQAEAAHELDLDRVSKLQSRLHELEALDQAERETAATHLVDRLLDDPASPIVVEAPQDRVSQIRVAEIAFRQAKLKSEISGATLKGARSRLETAEREYAQARAASLLPAFRETLDQLHLIGAKIIGARVVAREKGESFNPGHRIELGSWYGFESGALYGLAQLDWPDELRPNWAPEHPAHDERFPHEWTAIKLAAAELRAEIAQ